FASLRQFDYRERHSRLRKGNRGHGRAIGGIPLRKPSPWQFEESGQIPDRHPVRNPRRCLQESKRTPGELDWSGHTIRTWEMMKTLCREPELERGFFPTRSSLESSSY